MTSFFIDLSIIILVATILGLIAKIFRQPLILAYVITGIVLGPMGWSVVHESEALTLFSQIGIALLLFIVGVNLSPKNLREIGRISLIAGLGQVIFTAIAGFFLVKALGFQTIDSIYIAIALTLSSTIIIIKLLTDKNELDTLYGKILLGILLIQDLVAVITLVLITGLRPGSNIAIELILTIIKGIILLAGIWIVFRFIVSKFFNRASKTPELLFLGSVTWCFLGALAAIKLGFSLEMGAFLVGVAIGNSDYNFHIGAKVRPLRDFFIAIFFINLGLGMVFSSVMELTIPIIILSLFVLIGNPIIIFILMILIGYKSRTSLITGLALAQISEFSLILMAVGLKLGHVTQKASMLVAVVGIITITGSTYLITYSNKIYKTMNKFLKRFERKELIEIIDKKILEDKYDIILFGCHRTGYSIIDKIKDKKILVVDFNPKIIDSLKKSGIKAVNADIHDNEMIMELSKLKPKIVISTVPALEANEMIVREFKKSNKNTIIFVNTKNVLDILDLYKIGADFVIQPEMLAGMKISDYLVHLDNKGIRKWGKYYYRNFIEELKKGRYLW
ncbi:MAG TPA: cation:proton antiporter [Candidatus Nanoarchaeia archaeon]|nr:cation:proton antiporter [Candidatus Nanoarchaeia archaeon]